MLSFDGGSTERCHSTMQFHSLREENQRLEEEVNHLRNQIKQRDALLALLESQIGALVLERRAPHRIPDDGDEDDNYEDYDNDGEVVASHCFNDNDDKGSASYIDPASFNVITKVLTDVAEEENEDDCSQQADIIRDDNTAAIKKISIGQKIQSIGSGSVISSYRPSHFFPSLSRSPSLRPPTRKTTEMKHPPAPKPNDIYSVTPPLSLNGPILPRKGFQAGTTAIKALPRELSIARKQTDCLCDGSFHEGEDGCSKQYHEETENYSVVKTECMDAYNSRGIYSGTLQRITQMPHGKGRMDYHKGGNAGGRFYDGDWHVGHWHGKGIIRDLDGDVYEGQVVNDLKHGNGTIRFIDGRIFRGMFHEDEMVEGTMTYSDGAQYTGLFHHGKRHGQGVYHFPDGSIYEGGFVMDVIEGQGKMKWEDGGWYEGDWSHGDIHGFGIEYLSDGAVRHDGEWIKGVPLRKN